MIDINEGPIWCRPEVVSHALLLSRSFWEKSGEALIPELIPDALSLSFALYYAPFVLVSHTQEEDPIFNYANAAAQALWEMDWDEFTKTPSRLSAEKSEQENRSALLKEGSKEGIISNYSGVRISKSGRRFQIQAVTLWNVDYKAEKYGQAACFSNWQML
jgi:hypothetical protein